MRTSIQRAARGVALLLVSLLLLTGCRAIAPREKTLLLSEPAATPTPTSEPQSALRFEVRRITNIPLERLDPTGDHPDLSEAVVGWLDENNLIAMSVQRAVQETASPEEAAEPVPNSPPRTESSNSFSPSIVSTTSSTMNLGPLRFVKSM